MCGIVGIVDLKGRKIERETIKAMADQIIHRGPDDEGFFIGDGVAFGARRLKIIDLETGHQPQCNEDGTIWITYNGEIYNFLDLRRELEGKGHIFKTKSDTEVIVHLYEEEGEEGLKKLRGMFALGIWDGRKRRLLLARDRIGKKPLYYTIFGSTAIFSSEIKGILKFGKVDRKLDLNALDLYLTLEYIPSPLSIFKGIKKLMPGHYLIFDERGVQEKSYWELERVEVPSNIEEIKEELRKLIKESVKLRLISDVPLGAFLSGGIDSSTIVAMMHSLGVDPLMTFSIGFEEKSYNELKYARRIAELFETQHHEFVLKPSALELIWELVNYLDEPMSDFSIFPTYLISKMARKYVTVILSGDGGDELFGGYEHYLAEKLERLLRKYLFKIPAAIFPIIFHFLPPKDVKKGIINRIKRFSEGLKFPPELSHFRWMLYLDNPTKRRLYTSDFLFKIERNGEIYERKPFLWIFEKMKSFDDINRDLFLDLKSYLVDDIMVKVDRMSMACSLETRAPLLDHKLAEFVFSLPGNLKVRGFTTKWIFKKSMEGILPKEIIYRQKEGFSIPIKKWLREEFRGLMEDYLSEERIRKGGLFNYSEVKRIKEEHIKGIENHSHRLFALLLFEIWREKYLS